MAIPVQEYQLILSPRNLIPLHIVTVQWLHEEVVLEGSIAQVHRVVGAPVELLQNSSLRNPLQRRQSVIQLIEGDTRERARRESPERPADPERAAGASWFGE